MNYWLVKSEPNVYAWEQFQTDKVAVWDGVRNYLARNNLRAMQKGDLVLFYHSNIGLEVVGIAKVKKTGFPDPASPDQWTAVELVPYKKLKHPVSLKKMKNCPELSNMGLIRQSRLSVSALTEDEFNKVLLLSQEN